MSQTAPDQAQPKAARQNVGHIVPTLTERDFQRFRSFIHSLTGVSLSDAKQTLVTNRLLRRLKHYGLASYDEYWNVLSGPNAAAEKEIFVDLLTTHETYFFREPRHFEFLSRVVKERPGSSARVRVWSAACSSGEEAYSTAMVLAEALGSTSKYEFFASDVSEGVLAEARLGVYPLEAAEQIPQALLKRYCERGTGRMAGKLRVCDEIRSSIHFSRLNLMDSWRFAKPFDVVLLRNVMIYFDGPTKTQLVKRIRDVLFPGGLLLVGHAESLTGASEGLVSLAQGVYQRIANPRQGS